MSNTKSTDKSFSEGKIVKNISNFLSSDDAGRGCIQMKKKEKGISNVIAAIDILIISNAVVWVIGILYILVWTNV